MDENNYSLVISDKIISATKYQCIPILKKTGIQVDNLFKKLWAACLIMCNGAI